MLCGDSDADRVTVRHREPNPYASNARSEIVTCCLPDDTQLRLFCKYEARESQFWSDVRYEAQVYRQVLKGSALSHLRFYEACTDAVTGRHWLVLEYLDESVNLDELWDPNTVRSAAGWIGRFHAAGETHRPEHTADFLKEYDADYYRSHASRTLQFAGKAVNEFWWLPVLCRAFEETIGPLLAQRRTITHADFYPNNILLRHGIIYPIDWESAGVDVGEMDLACLTDGWPADVARECELEYQRARWGNAAPPDFERVLAAARVCLCFQRMCRPHWTAEPECQWYGRKLYALAEQLGLIS